MWRSRFCLCVIVGMWRQLGTLLRLCACHRRPAAAYKASGQAKATWRCAVVSEVSLTLYSITNIYVGGAVPMLLVLVMLGSQVGHVKAASADAVVQLLLDACSNPCALMCVLFLPLVAVGPIWPLA
jgi:hypothetical protein